MCGVDCVCATEPPCSSDNKFGDAGAASLAQALEKNTTLQSLYLYSEFVVVNCVCVWGRVLIVVYAVVGCSYFVLGVEGRVRGVDCVCATEPPCSSDNYVSSALLAVIGSIVEFNRQV